jgi:hypothetical protein
LPNFTSKLLLKLVIIFEMDGMDEVEKYAKANNIPIEVCRKMFEDYVLLPHEHAAEDSHVHR